MKVEFTIKLFDDVSNRELTKTELIESMFYDKRNHTADGSTEKMLAELLESVEFGESVKFTVERIK